MFLTSSNAFFCDSYSCSFASKTIQSSSVIVLNGANSRKSATETAEGDINSVFKTELSKQFTKPTAQNELRYYSSLSSQSHSPPLDQQITIRSGKKAKRRAKRRSQRQRLIQEKELIYKQQSLLLSAGKSQHREEMTLDELHKEYSSENPYQNWKPLSFDQSFELCQYALDKYHKK
ncbi:unnamed protein product [Adineta ricciae]|uniref:Uncharacterized protein n=1 Tax=Adineta ricciae TaxID=249248 RepID=A0A815EM44_ADIRI|nr:unnamed protein product [Adineta ricciae]